MIDLDELNPGPAANAGIDLTLRHPVSGELTGATITVLGAESTTYRRKLREIQRMRIQEASRTGATLIDDEQSESDAIELLVAITRGWSGLTRAGEPIEFSPEAAREVYRSVDWIRRQVDAGVHDLGNFLPGSASS